MSVPWYLMAKGKGGGGYKTASGPIVSINDALAAPLRSLRVAIDPVQAGTGDPSPDNVRPISGWDEANVWVKPIYDPTANPTATIQLGQTVYGGVWDVLSGVLKKTWGMAILANRTWTMETTANGNVFSCNLLPDKEKSYNQMCSKYKAVNNYRNYLKNGEMGTYNATNGRNRVSICDNTYSTVSDFVNGLAGVDYIYELATPLEYTLTPQQLDTLAGQNVMWADCGDVTLEYLAAGGTDPDLMKLAVAFMGKK